MYVRPILSLDAAHMKGSKGVLHMACMKVTSTLAVAFGALQKDNESIEGWSWFLFHLQPALID